MKSESGQPAVTLIGRKERAAYKDLLVPRCRANPMIEALPPTLEPEQVVEALERRPLYDPSERELPSSVRYQCIETLRDLFIPMDIHLELERRISCLIRNGYVPRNPLLKEHWAKVDANVEALSASTTNLRPRPVHTMAPSMHVFGISGGGKTTAIQNILLSYPQVIHHQSYRGNPFQHTQLTWLKIMCPFEGSTKGLCQNFFDAIDDVLGTNTRQRYADGRRTAHELLPSMARVAAANNLGLLVVDEVQHLEQFRSGGRETMLNFFCELVNTMCLPIILVGTYRAFTVLSADFRQIRRGCGQGDFVWEAMQKNEEFDYFVESMWPYQYTRRNTPLTRELCDVLFDECQGIVDFCVRLYMLSQGRAIQTQTEEVTPGIIRSVARDCFRSAQEVLRALREKDFAALQRFHDVCPIEFVDQMRRFRSSASVRQSKRPSALPPMESERPEPPVKLPQKPKQAFRVITPVPASEGLVAVAQSGLRENIGAYTALKAAGFMADANAIAFGGIQ